MDRHQLLQRAWPGDARGRRIIGGGLGLVLIIAAIAMVGGLHRFGATPGLHGAADVGDAIPVTAEELAISYRHNQAGGDHKYGQRLLLLNGRVLRTALGRSGQAEVVMEGGVIAEISADSHVLVSSVGAGDTLALLCDGVRLEANRPHALNCLFHDAELIKPAGTS